MIQKNIKNNNQKSIKFLCFEGLFVLIVVIVLFIPLYLYLTGYKNNLSGVEYKVTTPSFTIESFKDNTYQDNVDKYLEQNLPGKDIAVNFRNQLLYDTFKISPHDNIDIGVDDTLFFEETIDYYCHGLYNVSDEYMNTLMGKLEELNNICDETGKKLVLVITPTKPRYYEDKIPAFDKMMVDINKIYGKEPTAYDKFISKLEKSNILYFDSIDYIDKNIETLNTDEHPLWMKGGHHWTMYQGGHVGIALEDFIIKYTEHELPKFHIVASRSEVPIYPDDDILDLLNIKNKPTYTYDHVQTIFDSAITTYPNVLVRGGSFLGMLQLPCCTIGLDNIVYHIENKYYFTDHYMNHTYFDEYDEIKNLKENLSKFDIIILEIHEVNVYNATFGFLDYLLENKEEFYKEREIYTVEASEIENVKEDNEIDKIDKKEEKRKGSKK